MSVILVRLFKNPALLSIKAAYFDSHLLCRIVAHSGRMQLLTAQFSAIVNTEPEEHTTDVPKRELPGTIGDSLSPELDAHAAWQPEHALRPFWKMNRPGQFPLGALKEFLGARRRAPHPRQYYPFTDLA
jgi:hypothetical protein